MVDCAPWEKLRARVPDWHTFVDEGGNVEEDEAKEDETEENGETEAAAVANGKVVALAATPAPALHLPTLTGRTQPPSKSKEDTMYIPKEERVHGGVSGETYFHYFRDGGVARAGAVAALLIVAQGALMASDLWIKIWASSSTQERDFYPCVYAGLMAAVVVLGFVK